MKHFWRRIVGCFVAGAFAILPLVITVAVVAWVANFIAGFVGPDTAIGSWLSSIGLNFVSEISQKPTLASYAMGWVMVLAVIFALGVVLELGAKRIFEQILEAIVSRVPLLGNLYSTSKQVVQMLDKKDEDALKGMSPVFCFFGEENGAGVLALLVSPNQFEINGRYYQAVVIPTAPVPFGGGLFFVPTDRVSPAGMSVDGLMSVYVSMGVTTAEYLPTKAGGKKGS